MATLVVIDGREQDLGQTIPVFGSRFIIGRLDDCDLYSVFQGESRVSRRHACIVEDGGRFLIEDLQSRNGTYLNGNRISDRVELLNGDHLRICDVAFRVVISSSDRDDDSGSHLSSVDSVLFDETDSPRVDSFIRLSEADISTNPVRKFQSLVRLLGNLGQSLDELTILRQLLEGLFEVFPRADRGMIALADEPESAIVPRVVLNRSDIPADTMRVSQTLFRRAMNAQEAILSADAMSDQRFDTAQSISDASIRSLMCVPLTDPARQSYGIIQLDTISGRGQFDESDLEILASITPHAATALAYARFHAEAMLRERLDRDLQLARKVQQSLLPDGPPKIDGYEFHAYYRAAAAVGGDHYDYLDLPGGRLAIVVADVVGKGVSAALLTARIAGEWKYLLSSEESPSAAVARMNDSFYASHRSHQFVTLVLAVIDVSSHRLTIVNAGHPSPILRNANGEVVTVGDYVGGPPVGMMPDEEYEPVDLQLEPGDCLFLFTDGLTEAMSEKGGLYTTQRLLEQVRQGPTELGPLVTHVLTDVDRFVDRYPQSDDICISCFRRI